MAADLPDDTLPESIALWRKAERARRLAAREGQTVAGRQVIAAALARHLDALLARRFGTMSGWVVSGYWPIRAEPDLRPWLTALHGARARVALPVVAERAAPLQFRPWSAGAKMERGRWNILVPATAETVLPQIALAPLVGWDDAGYRLGYGGGYFDRTLAALSPRPYCIGVGLQSSRIASIHPQPHDIGFDAVVTEAGLQWERGAG
jgi:5,10-methenyltetrahydrofolate synthetase